MSYCVYESNQHELQLQSRGGSLVSFPLEVGQCVPDEFKPGDEVDVAIKGTENTEAYLHWGLPLPGYYQVEHVKTGTIHRAWHRAIK